MKNQRLFTGILLISLGIYFLIKQLNLPFLQPFNGWSTIVIIIGLALFIYSYFAKDYEAIFSSTIALGIGIHFHGLASYSFWTDHWAVYLLIVGIAYIIRYFKTKSGLVSGISLIAFSLFMLLSIKLPKSINWIYQVIEFIETFWPATLLVLGVYLLRFKKE